MKIRFSEIIVLYICLLKLLKFKKQLIISLFFHPFDDLIFINKIIFA